MPRLTGRVAAGQDPATRIQNVIDSASGWIPAADTDLVEQGKQLVLAQVSAESWVEPYVWEINWVNLPPQEAVQTVNVGITPSNDLI